MSNAANPKPGKFDEEWAKLDLAPLMMRSKVELPEASLIVTSVKPGLTVGGTLQTRTMLAPFGHGEVKVVHGEEEDQSAGRLIVQKFPDGTRNEEQGPSKSGKNLERDDGQGGSRRSEEPMQQDPDQAGKKDDKASTGGVSSLDFENFLSDFENGMDSLEATTEPADEGTSTLKHPSAIMGSNRKLSESGSPSNSKDIEQKLLMKSQRRRRIEGAARVPFLGTLAEEEWEVHHRDHENRTGCRMDRMAFLEEVWTVVQSYRAQSLLKGTMQSKLVIDKINEMKMKLGSKVTLRKAGKTKVDSEISMKAVNSAKRKNVEEAMDLG